MRTMIQRLRASDPWRFFSELPRASRGLAVAWWAILLLRGLLPAAFAIAIGGLVGSVETGDSAALPLVVVGLIFVLLQIASPLHQSVSANLGSSMTTHLYDRLTRSCVSPPGVGHLEDPELRQDLTMARDFDLGITGPPLFIAMDFIASGMVEMVAGIASALVLAGYAWWAPLVVGTAWFSTQWLLRESGVYRDRNTSVVREAQRHADYAFRLAVDAPAAKELRLFGLSRHIVDGFRKHRRRLYELRWEATRLRERPLVWSILIVTTANLFVFSSMARDIASGQLALDQLVTFATAAVGASLIAFGGLSWALDGASAPVGAVSRLEPAMRAGGALSQSDAEARESSIEASRVSVQLAARAPAGLATANPSWRAPEIRFENVSFAYPRSDRPILRDFSLHIPAGSSMAIVGQNGAGKTTLAKLLCRFYDPTSGSIEVDGVPLSEWNPEDWREHLTAVFQDFIRLELPLRDNVAPSGASDAEIRRALEQAGAAGLAELDTILARGYPGGTELSGGQWQRVALARSLCAVARGARLVLLDEPTAQLDVRGESEIFGRVLAATERATTVLISHRFSTVRQVDRICVLEHGSVIELGSHAELMALGGRYRTMFDLQASRFESDSGSGAGFEGGGVARSGSGEAEGANAGAPLRLEPAS